MLTFAEELREEPLTKMVLLSAVGTGDLLMLLDGVALSSVRRSQR